MLHQIHKQPGGTGVHLRHPLHNGGVAEDLPRHIQADHGDGTAGGEADVGGLRVRQDVELRRRGDVSVGIGAAHQNDPPNFLRRARLHPQGHGQIRHGSGGDHGDVSFRGQQRAGQEAHRVFLLRRFAQRREDRAVQTRLAVDVSRRYPVPDHGSSAARVDRNILPAQPLQYPAGIPGGVVQSLVPRHNRDAQELQLQAVRRQHEGDGVVMPGVAVADDLLSYHRCRSLPKRFRFRIGTFMVTYSFFLCNGKMGALPLSWQTSRAPVLPPVNAASSANLWAVILFHSDLQNRRFRATIEKAGRRRPVRANWKRSVAHENRGTL